MPGCGDEFGPRKSSASARSASVGEHVERRERRGRAPAARGSPATSAVEELVVELPLAGERALLRRERLVLERLELGRDVALGVLQRLPAAIVVGNLLGMGVRDLDVVAVDAVVLDLQVRDAAALALARFEVDQELRRSPASIARSSSSSAS